MQSSSKSVQQNSFQPSDAEPPSFQLPKSRIEICEKRLVLSAQLLMDLDFCEPQVEPTPISLHGEMGMLSNLELHGEITQPTTAAPTDLTVQPHLSDAHQASGWTQVRQQFGLGGQRQTVAVIDSGIAWDHEALGGGFGSEYRVVGGWDFTEENDALPYDDGPAGFHGTHVAGIVAADGGPDGDPAHTGVAPEADLVALRVFNDQGQGQLSWVENALRWVRDNQDSFENPITTVNLSLGTNWNSDDIPGWATLEEELRDLANDGILVVASAGNSFAQYNEPGLSYPAASEYVLPVASVDSDGNLSDFSQRNQRVLAAPGEHILSTVPDHVYGIDGQVNDYSNASGTSMAAPYVSGAAVLVREAMEMVGLEGITTQSITDHLRTTADSVFDAATGLSYQRLNLFEAIDTLIPNDLIGDQAGNAHTIELATSNSIDGWLNSTSDTDAYTFTTQTRTALDLDFSSEWLDSLSWSLTSSSQTIASGGLGSQAIELAAGETYVLSISSQAEIGSFGLQLDAQQLGAPPAEDLGVVDYYHSSTDGNAFRLQAANDGVLSVSWNAATGTGTLDVQAEFSGQASDATSEQVDGKQVWRIDTEVVAGEWIDISLPQGSEGELTIGNVVQFDGDQVVVNGTFGRDIIDLSLSDDASLTFNSLRYELADGVTSIAIDGNSQSDQLNVVGSTESDKVELRPGQSTLSNASITVSAIGVEEVNFEGGGGPDRVYLYDSDDNDTLHARPRNVQLEGAGYEFNVSDVDRVFMHSTGGGRDYAYLYDSEGDDTLNMRPKFASIRGDNFFNYVRGFERVYAYATEGGVDSAFLYDSEGQDRFFTSGQSASMVGADYSSFTREFENVVAHAHAGGGDEALLYGSGQQTSWSTGADFTKFNQETWEREARGFGSVEAFLDGSKIQSLSSASFAATWPVDDAPEPNSAEKLDTPSIAPADANAQPAQAPLEDLQSERSSDWVTFDDSASELAHEAAREIEEAAERQMQLLDDLFAQL